MPIKIPFLDLKPQHEAIQPELGAAMERVMSRSWFILGQELEGFEAEFAAYCSTKHCVGVGSGTEALHLALRACDIGPGDEVVTVSNTAIATALAISWTGATPVFVDIDPLTYTMDVGQAAEAVTPRTKAILPVHLYGQPADMDPLKELADRKGLRLIEDACQAHGATYKGRRVGGIGHMGCFSFYPSKNLGACGDGGAVTTDDDRLAKKLRLLRNYGETRKYHHEIPGFNSRLDELQAAILRVKLTHLDAWNALRRSLAQSYDRLLGACLSTAGQAPQRCSVCHLYVIRTPQRDSLQHYLQAHGVGTLIHYPIPIHLQNAYAGLKHKGSRLPVTEAYAGQILSLPLNPFLSEESVGHIAGLIQAWAGSAVDLIPK